MIEKYTLKTDKKRYYHCDSIIYKAEFMLIMVLFYEFYSCPITS